MAWDIISSCWAVATPPGAGSESNITCPEIKNTLETNYPFLTYLYDIANDKNKKL